MRKSVRCSVESGIKEYFREEIMHKMTTQRRAHNFETCTNGMCKF